MQDQRWLKDKLEIKLQDIKADGEPGKFRGQRYHGEEEKS